MASLQYKELNKQGESEMGKVTDKDINWAIDERIDRVVEEFDRKIVVCLLKTRTLEKEQAKEIDKLKNDIDKLKNKYEFIDRVKEANNG
jgi:single-stranded DNA-specific DHH superfamily exonuclease